MSGIPSVNKSTLNVLKQNPVRPAATASNHADTPLPGPSREAAKSLKGKRFAGSSKGKAKKDEAVQEGKMSPALQNFFSRSLIKNNKMSAFCNLCDKNVVANVGVTSNFHRHLKTTHNSVYEESRKTSGIHGHQDINEDTITLYDASHPRQKAIGNALMNMIAIDLLPLSLVDMQGFTAFMNVVDPKFEAISRRTITRKFIDEVTNKIVPSIKEGISNLPNKTLHLTTDLWTSTRQQSVLGLKTQFITDNWTLKTQTIAFRQLTGRHTGANIGAAVEDILTEFNINHTTVGYAITDNGSNMIKAFDILNDTEREDANDDDPNYVTPQEETDVRLVLDEYDNDDDIQVDFEKWSRLACAAHTLQLVVRDGLKSSSQAQKLLMSVRTIVRFFRKSTYWSEKLEEESQVRLITDNATRWNSQLYMISRLIEENVWTAIIQIIGNARLDMRGRIVVPNLPNAQMKEQLAELVCLLTPFQEGTDALQGDGVTSSLVIPTIVGIHEEVTKITCVHFATLKQSLTASLGQRFSKCAASPHYILATVLDPRLKLCPFKENGEDDDDDTVVHNPLRSNADVAVRLLRSHYFETDPELVEQESIVVGSELQSQRKIFSFLATSLTKRPRKYEEVDFYLQEGPVNGDPLKYWELKSKDSPVLAQLARQYLGIPATSGGVERLFSLASNIGRAKRARLTVNTMETLILFKEYKNI